MAKADSTGAGVARNMMHVLTDAVVKVRSALIPHENAERIKHNIALIEAMEQDIIPTVTALYQPILDDPNCPPYLKAFLSQITAPTHQGDLPLQIIGTLGALLVMLPTFGQIMLREDVMGLNQSNTNVPLSPPDAAEAVMRGVIDQSTGEAMAASSGVSPGVFADMIGITGEPPGPIDMINLWRWGRISDDDLETGLLFSRVNDKYIPMMKLLSQGNMSPADAIELAVKGIMTPAEGAVAFQTAGGNPIQWDVLYEAAGDAIGNEAAIGLYNQGLITQDQLLQVFGRSRMNPIFYPIAEQLKHKFLQPFQISAMLKAGSATPEQAAVWMTNLGYNAEQVAAFTGGSPTTTLAKAKSDTEAMIMQEYTEQIITAQAAHNALVNIGYNNDQANMLTSLQDAKAAKSERDTAVAGVKSAMVKGHLSKTEASSALDTLGVPSSARDGLISAWGVEQSTQVKVLTEAQIGIAARNNVITYNEAIARWVAQGYSTSDADILAAQYGGGPLTT